MTPTCARCGFIAEAHPTTGCAMFIDPTPIKISAFTPMVPTFEPKLEALTAALDRNTKALEARYGTLDPHATCTSYTEREALIERAEKAEAELAVARVSFEKSLLLLREDAKREIIDAAVEAVLNCNDRGRDTAAWQEAVLPILQDAARRVRAVKP